jgi:hypothetical protein
MFVVQISLLIVTFMFVISRDLSLMQTIKEVNPHPRIASCVNMWSVTTNDWGYFWARSVEILVFGSPTGYTLTSSGFLLLNWGTFYGFLENDR